MTFTTWLLLHNFEFVFLGVILPSYNLWQFGEVQTPPWSSLLIWMRRMNTPINPIGVDENPLEARSATKNFGMRLAKMNMTMTMKKIVLKSTKGKKMS